MQTICLANPTALARLPSASRGNKGPVTCRLRQRVISCRPYSIHASSWPVVAGHRRRFVSVCAASVAGPAVQRPQGGKGGKLSDSADSQLRQVAQELESQSHVLVAQTAPAIRVSLGEELGLAPGTNVTHKMITALRRMGFKYVFDVCCGADLTIMEEGTELCHRMQGLLSGRPSSEVKLPMFTSCCPGWISYVEECAPELIPYLSTCKSPHLMQGAVIKQWWAPEHGLSPQDVSVVSVMPCVRKQGEADRRILTGGEADVDHVITTRDLGEMMRSAGIQLGDLEDGEFDSPFGEASGGGVMFGTTGGVMEAAVRTVYELATGEMLKEIPFEPVRGMTGVKEATVGVVVDPKGPLGGGDGDTWKLVDLKLAVVHGLGNAKKIVKQIESGECNYHFVEVMACPGGCVGGGGQPRSTDKTAVSKRQAALYAIDAQKKLRKSHMNADVQQLYNKFLEHPNSHLAEELLHTTYVPGGMKALTDASLAGNGKACAESQTKRMATAAPGLAAEPAQPLVDDVTCDPCGRMTAANFCELCGQQEKEPAGGEPEAA